MNSLFNPLYLSLSLSLSRHGFCISHTVRIHFWSEKHQEMNSYQKVALTDFRLQLGAPRAAACRPRASRAPVAPPFRLEYTSISLPLTPVILPDPVHMCLPEAPRPLRPDRPPNYATTQTYNGDAERRLEGRPRPPEGQEPKTALFRELPIRGNPAGLNKLK